VESKAFIKKLYDEGIIMFGEFTLTSGLRSPYYIDLRKALSKPDLLREITNVFAEKIREIGNYDVIVGIETGSIPWAATVAYVLNKPMAYVRKKPKGHGAGKLIEGEIPENAKAIIIDDVATTGQSILRAANALRSMNVKVEDALVFVDREQGARELLEKKDITLHTVFTVTQIVDELFNQKLISRDVYLKIKSYIEGFKNV